MEIRELLDREVRSKVLEIISHAEERASEILNTAERKREEILQNYKPRAEEAFKKEYFSIISRAQREGSKKILEVQREILILAREKAEKMLKEISEDKDRYTEVMKYLVEESLKYMRNGVEVRVNPRDKELAESVLKELPGEWIINPPKTVSVWNVDMGTWKVIGDESVWAGMVFVDKERNFILNSDLRVRLERAYNLMLEEFRGELEVEG